MLFSPFVYTSTRREQHTFNGTLATLTQLREVIKSLETHNVTASNFVLLLLRDNRLQDLPCTQNLIDQADEILQAFYEHPKSSKSALTWANDLMKSRYAASVRELANKENRWHFGALHASAQKLQEFRIEDMAQKMEELAPELWDLLGLIGFATVSVLPAVLPKRVTRVRVRLPNLDTAHNRVPLPRYRGYKRVFQRTDFSQQNQIIHTIIHNFFL